MMFKSKNILDKSNFNSPSGVKDKLPFRGWGFLLLFFSISVFSQTSLYDNFKTPPAEAKPWTFWYWMHGAVSKEGIKADLEAMKEIGLGGTYLMPIRGVEGTKYPKPVNQLTPEWWEMVRYSMYIADSLGLQLGMHISDGFALAGGPWILPEESMQKVVFSDTIIKGGKVENLSIQRPESYQGFYQDIAIYALPLSKHFSLKEEYRDSTEFMVTSDLPDNPHPFSNSEQVFRSEKPCYIQFAFKKPFTLRSIEITPAGNNLQSQRLTVMAGNDTLNFYPVKKLTPPRHGWQDYNFSKTFSIPATTARYFRFMWTPAGTEAGSEDFDAAKWTPTLKIKRLQLSSSSRINQWEGKSGLAWRIADETTVHEIPDADCTPKDKIINLTPFFKDGKLTCRLPKGNWRIVRMGHTSTGMTNATGGGGKGLECDKFSEKAVQKQFDHWFGAAFEKTDRALAHRVLKFMHIDSWECGCQNWSTNFAAEFNARRGYDLLPYLPLLAGYPIESVRKSEEVLRDVRTTISELVDDVFYKVLVKNGKNMGCEISAESVAPTFVSDGMLHFKEVDRPMGEFWLRSPTHDKPNDMLDAVSAAHIYGKNIIQAEGFTQLRTIWDEDPALVKPLLDRNFALGMNKFFFHVFVHNPYLDKAPGSTLSGMGLFFQRDQTWWKPGKAFVDYVTRCQALLQYGKPVADIAVFTGEEVPSRAFTPNKLIDWLPGIIGSGKVEEEKRRLANVNQPVYQMPAGVTCSANILDPAKWVNPLNGYAYDSFNKDVLLSRSKAKNGKISFFDGNEYKILIFPNGSEYSPEVLTKIEEIRKEGVVIPALPVKSPDFGNQGIEPDVAVPAQVAWNHRRTAEADIYFISNQKNSEQTIEASFRIQGKTPELFYPVSGAATIAQGWRTNGRRTDVKLTLAPFESVFVVFASSENAAKTVGSFHKKDSTNLIPEGKWKVRFEKMNRTIESDCLFDWSKDTTLLRYFSGTAVYRNSFRWSVGSPSEQIFLNLGKVCNLAAVRINGVACGTAWTAPYEVEISKALKNGINTLEIEVTNTWANAINGWDKGTPPFSGIWTDGQYRMKEDKLLEAGLLGPVRIVKTLKSGKTAL